MMNYLIIFLSGLLFAIGLGISGLTDPNKVLGFLNIGGVWDPSLLCTMGGAVIVSSLGYQWARKRSKPFRAPKFQIPKMSKITPRLVIGSLLFGIGWGLAGFCPGPALTAVFSGASAPIYFTLSMAVGMVLYQAVSDS